MEKLPLSLVVIAANEEKQIERCLRSVPFAGEVLVIDGFSQDRTKEIAEACGARVLQEKWRGFGPQKRFGVEQASFDWILSLDADEALSPEASQELKSRFSSLDSQTGYLFPRRSFHLGRWIGYGGWFPDWQLRLFHRQAGNWEGEIHEKVKTPKQERFQAEIQHWVFEDLSDQVRTNDRYSSLQAQDLHKAGRAFSLWALLLRPWGKFIECYLIKRGFLDGLPGFIIAVGAAHSMFLRYAKLWELEKKSRINR